jgi:AraC-like DNA-binding protein
MSVGELEGILPYDWGIMLRIIYGISFSVAQFLLIRKNKIRIRKQGLESFKSEEVFKWLYYFTTWLLVSFSLLFVRLIFDSSFYINISQAIYISISLSILFTCFYLFFNPVILYGIREIFIQEPLLAKEELLNTAANLKLDDATTVLPVDEPDWDFRTLIINHFTLNKPFLKVGYNLNNLSNELDIPVYRLSANMNQVFGMNFKELVNDFRIDYINDSLKSSDNQHKYSLDGLAEFGGFKSRNSLINAVKKKTGETPTAYFSQFITLKPGV